MRHKTWPWIALLCLCACFALFSVLMLVLDTPSQQPHQPSTTPPDQTDHAAAKFEALFSDPDWEALYSLASIPDTQFENATTYANYMTDKVGDIPLTCQEVRTDIPQTHRYLVNCGTTKIAAYTLTEPDWALGKMELFFDRSVSITVQTPPDYTVFVNGAALDETYTVRTLQTKAEKYLPDGLHGIRQRWQTVTGMFCEPTLTAVDANGSTVKLIYADGIYQLADEQPAEITQQQIDFLSSAAKADARYAIGAIREAELAKYFDESSDLYQMLTDNPRNLQKYTSSSVEDIVVGEFVQYSDTLFSANVKLTQKIIRTSGTLKTYTMDKTYFFIRTVSGEYRVTAYTNEHMTDLIETVRLTFVTDSEPVSMVIDATAQTVNPPAVDNADTFLGWATRSVSEDGTIVYTVRILPDGTVLGELEPMQLYPVLDVA